MIRIAEFKNCLIYEDGTVYSKEINKILLPNIDKRGRFKVKIEDKYYYIDYLVAKNFVENTGGLKKVKHINNNLQDNRASNLEWY